MWKRKYVTLCCSYKTLICSPFFDNFNYIKYCNGATYVPLESAFIFKKEISNPFISIIVDDNEDGDPEATVTFQKIWSYVIYPCQTTSTFGVYFSQVPSFKTNSIFKIDSGFPWVVATILTIIESLWRLVEKFQLQRSKFLCCMLIYLSYHYFQNWKIKISHDPYKLYQTSYNKKLLAKLKCNYLIT